MSPQLAPRACSRPLCAHTQPCPVHHRASRWEGRPGSVARGYGREWRRRRERILARDPVCTVCRLRPSAMVDHLTAKADGGSDDDRNLRGICRACHDAKTGREGQRRSLGAR